MSLILNLSLVQLIDQAKPNQAKLSSNFLIFPQAQIQTLFLDLSRAQTKLEFLTFLDEPNLNMYYSKKLGSFIVLTTEKTNGSKTLHQFGPATIVFLPQRKMARKLAQRTTSAR